MLADIRAESMVQLRRPANLLLLGAAGALTLTFGYVVPYAGDRGSTPRGRLLPGHFADTAIDGLPLFIGALALIFGVLVAGGDYAWQTWKTLLVQRPSRGAVFAGKVCTLAIGALVLVVTLLAVAAVASLVVVGIEGADANWPTAGEVLTDIAAGWLIAFMWAMLGVTLAIALRSVAVPVGIGLVWMLAVQNLISGMAAPLLDWVDAAQQWLPGPAAGSLVATLGGNESTPGVTQLAGPTQCWLVLIAYLTAFTVPAAAVLVRRDLT